MSMIDKSDVVYLSGPMSGLPVGNSRAFFGLAGSLERVVGCRVLNPARHLVGMPKSWYMARAFEDLRKATVMVLLDGWENSIGAKAEVCEAVRLNIRLVMEHDVQLQLDIEFENKSNGGER